MGSVRHQHAFICRLALQIKRLLLQFAALLLFISGAQAEKRIALVRWQLHLSEHGGAD